MRSQMLHLDRPLSENITNEFTFSPMENPDWGFARNNRCVLMTPSAEWVQSIYSCQFELNGKRLVVPNRDYPYEGLLVCQDGENWKFIDCIALSLQKEDGSYLPIDIDAVTINPWSVSYRYKITNSNIKSSFEGEMPFFVTYYLNSKNSPELVTGFIELKFPNGLFCNGIGIITTIQPFLDIRHMYSSSNFHDYKVDSGEYGNHKRIDISSYNRTLSFYLPPLKSRLFDYPELLNWRYKLGTGRRIESSDHKTIFGSEDKNVAVFFNLQIPSSYDQKFIRLFFSCSLNDSPTKISLPSIEKIAEQSEESMKIDHDQFHQLKEIFPIQEKYRDAIIARIAGLTKFKTYVRYHLSTVYIKVPPAGALWFKTPWYRDVFEGILSSFQTLMKIPEEKENIKEIISIALIEQDKTGLILNRLPEYKTSERSHNSSDGTLLCFITANAYIGKTKDLDFALKILPNIEHTILSFQNSNNDPSLASCADGPPRVDIESGLLLSAPHHSWIDTSSQCIEYAGRRIEWIPNRVSKKFVKDIYDCVADKERVRNHLLSPSFFLPEINAQWITMLKGTVATIDFVEQKTTKNSFPELKRNIVNMISQAEKNFKDIFWNNVNSYLFNIVYKDGIIKDEIECETGVTAAAMLGESIFSQTELSYIWDLVRKKLLVYRRLVKYEYEEETLPFGIITKNDDERIYYNDNQYHSDVIWLRSTPYLIKLLKLLNQEKTIKEILINTLDHQMTECAIFYNQELFSRPFGNNPAPDDRTCKNPVPVKNPIQFWSQWCDAFVEYFAERSH